MKCCDEDSLQLVTAMGDDQGLVDSQQHALNWLCWKAHRVSEDTDRTHADVSAQFLLAIFAHASNMHICACLDIFGHLNGTSMFCLSILSYDIDGGSFQNIF